MACKFQMLLLEIKWFQSQQKGLRSQHRLAISKRFYLIHLTIIYNNQDIFLNIISRMSSLMKKIVKLAEQFLKANPSPTSIQLFSPRIMKLGYTYSSPYSNSKLKKQMLYNVASVQSSFKSDSYSKSLVQDDKSKSLIYANNFDSIQYEQYHEKVLQDAIFGSAKLNQFRDRWIYVAQKKQQKNKSYFNGGSGKNIYSHDFGQTYDDITQVGIYLWDMKRKKIFAIDIKVQGEDQNTRYSFACPIFANAEGTQFICHGYQTKQFGYGISHCFNRPVYIFYVCIDNLQTSSTNEQLKIKVVSQKIVSEYETNMFANISPCYQYITYFAGQDFIHSYYLSIVVLQKINTIQQPLQQQSKTAPLKLGGYVWIKKFEKKDAFVGSYLTLKTHTFLHQNQPHLYFQTVQKAKQVLKVLKLKTGQIIQISKNGISESYSLTSYFPQQNLLTGIVTSHQKSTFFYLNSKQNLKNSQIVQIPALFQQAQFYVQQYTQPIHAYYLSSSEKSEKNQKRPLLVMVHGGPHGFGDPAITLLKYILIKCGFSILIPNFSGSVGFGKQHLKAAVGHLGDRDAKQIIQILNKVLEAKQSQIDRENVHVYGGSYGGYMAAIMGSRFDKYFKSAVILNGVLSIPGNFWFSDIPQWSTAQALGVSKINELTADDYVKMFNQSPMSHPMRIPTLQFLGSKDRRVPYRQGLLFDAMTKKFGTKIKTYVYENSGHSLSDSVETQLDIIIKTMLFLMGEDLQLISKQVKLANSKKQEDKLGLKENSKMQMSEQQMQPNKPTNADQIKNSNQPQ